MKITKGFEINWKLSQEISDLERKEGRLNHLIEETLRRERELKSLEKKLKELSDEYNNLDLLRKYLFDKSNFSRYFTGEFSKRS